MSAIGYKGILGLAKQTAMETAIDVTDRVPFMSEGLKVTPAFVDHDYLSGTARMRDIQNVFNPAGGTLEVPAVYTALNTGKFVSMDLLLAAAMGTSAWDAANEVNQLTFKDDLDVMLTAAIYKGITGIVWESLACFVNSMTLSCAAGESLKASFELIIGELIKTGTVNEQADLVALPDDLIQLLTFNQMTFRIGDHSGALSSSEEVCISSMEVSVNNNLSSDEQATPCTANSDSKTQIQPVRNGFRETTLSIELPRYASDAFQTWKSAGTNLQCDIVFTDGTNSFTIMLPNLIVTDSGAAIGGAGAVKQTVTFKALGFITGSEVAFSDASTDLGELWIELDNERTAAII